MPIWTVQSKIYPQKKVRFFSYNNHNKYLMTLIYRRVPNGVVPLKVDPLRSMASLLLEVRAKIRFALLPAQDVLVANKICTTGSPQISTADWSLIICYFLFCGLLDRGYWSVFPREKNI